MACPASIRLSEGVEQKRSVFAEEGSAAHFLAEVALLGRRQAAEYLDRVIRPVGGGFSILKAGAEPQDGDYLVTEEMAEAVQIYLDTVREGAGNGSRLVIEKKFDLGAYVPGMFGTVDAARIEPFKKVTVIDLKYGAGVAVEVEENPQLKIYGLGACQGELPERVELVIVQPRARHRDGPVRRWEVAAADLEKWAREELVPAALATEDPAAPIAAGNHCRFCPALGGCPAVRDLALEVARADFQDPPEFPAPELLSNAELARVLTFNDVFKSWIKAAEAEGQNRMERGEVLEGFKLVRKRTRRRWIDEEQAAARLSLFAEYFVTRLISPAQAYKAGSVEKAVLDALVETPEGGLTIAPEADRREAVLCGPAIDFDDALLI
jgi:hypothetical protein